jgi:CBS domain-containing protein
VRLAKAPPGPVMTAVRHILDQKGQQVWSVHPGDTFFDAIKMMAGALVVLDGSKIVGIVTERDYARNVFLKGRASPQTLVSEIMAPNLVCVEPDKSIEEGMAIMTAKRVRHLPVIDDGEFIGIVSIGGQEHHQRSGVRDRAVGALHPRSKDVDHRRERPTESNVGLPCPNSPTARP